MNILGIDTSTKAASVSIMQDDQLIGEILINDKRTHSQKLMPMLENLLNLANIKIKDIDLLAVCVGPGSFTGLRIALATVKAISHVRNIPIIGVNSLECLAFNLVETDRVIVPILDAQSNQVYTCKYIFKDYKLINLEDVSLMTIDKRLNNIDKKAIFLGEVCEKYYDKIAENGYEVAPFDRNIMKSSNICSIGKYKYENNIDVYNCYDILPLYMKKSQAEEQYDKKQK